MNLVLSQRSKVRATKYIMFYSYSNDTMQFLVYQLLDQQTCDREGTKLLASRWSVGYCQTKVRGTATGQGKTEGCVLLYLVHVASSDATSRGNHCTESATRRCTTRSR